MKSHLVAILPYKSKTYGSFRQKHSCIYEMFHFIRSHATDIRIFYNIRIWLKSHIRHDPRSFTRDRDIIHIMYREWFATNIQNIKDRFLIEIQKKNPYKKYEKNSVISLQFLTFWNNIIYIFIWNEFWNVQFINPLR